MKTDEIRALNDVLGIIKEFPEQEQINILRGAAAFFNLDTAVRWMLFAHEEKKP